MKKIASTGLHGSRVGCLAQRIVKACKDAKFDNGVPLSLSVKEDFTFEGKPLFCNSCFAHFTDCVFDCRAQNFLSPWLRCSSAIKEKRWAHVS